MSFQRQATAGAFCHRMMMLLLAIAWAHPAAGNMPEWPRVIRVPEADIVIYQPQLETFSENKLTCRAAVSVTKKGSNDPVFGAVWVTARVETDRDERQVTLMDIDVTDVKFPNADPGQLKQLESILETHVPENPMSLSLDRLLAMLDLVEKEKAASEALNVSPPKIIAVKHPAVLVTIDGLPRLARIENSSVMRVVNTPFLMAFDPAEKAYYLSAGDQWLYSRDIVGSWTATTMVPGDVRALTAAQPTPELGGEATAPDRMPQVIVATEPTELIVVDGEPEFGTIRGTDLLYVTNTESDAFLQVDPQQIFVLLSGRWYTATSKDGPWSHVPADALPDDFAKISPGSAKGHVLAHVAGTEEARDAVLETQIPQTAAISRADATLTVEYDGAPEFAVVEGTEMHYSINTPYSVIQVGPKYHCCHEAIWYESDSPTGPWIVSVSVPQVIYTIPPSCPVYNVKYVYIYESTPEVVYIGYTPGYVGCYAYGGAVVYGTGHNYHGWHGSAYYARPATWGFSVRYNSYTGGWAFRAGYAGPRGAVAVGGIHVGGVDIHGSRGGWWGAGGYRRANIDVDVDIHAQRNIYGRASHPANPRGALDPRGVLDPRGALDPRGIADPRGALDPRGVRDPRGVADPRGALDPRGVRDPRGTSTSQGLANNVFADKNGNVYRKSLDGWQQRSGTGWSNPNEGLRSPTDRGAVTSSRTPSRTSQTTPSPATRSELDRQQQARSRGTTKTSSYSKSRSSSGRSSSRSGGGSRGRR